VGGQRAEGEEGDAAIVAGNGGRDQGSGLQPRHQEPTHGRGRPRRPRRIVSPIASGGVRGGSVKGPIESDLERGVVAMNAERLLEHYEKIAEAPDAIPKLRRFILDLAVRGKLVPQDPKDEPAEELFKRIEAEKALVERPKRGRAEFSGPIDSTDEPFEVPKSWKWVRLGVIAELVRGVSFPAQAKSTTRSEDDIPCLRSGNIQSEVEWSDLIFVPRTTLKSDRQFVREGDIIISIANSYELVGKCAIVRTLKDEATFGAFLAAIRLYKVSQEYMQYCLSSNYSAMRFRKGSSQTTNIANITFSTIRNHSTPLPPLAEQQRIVAKVDELMGICDRLEVARKEREEVRDGFTTSTLGRLSVADESTFRSDASFAIEHLRELTTRPDQIKQLRQAILNLAVRGKLVPQDPNDEPASELLKRIEKTRSENDRKRRKIEQPNVSEYAEEIPKGWTLVRIGQVFSIRTGYAFKSTTYSAKGILVFRVTNFDRDGNYDLSDTVFYPEEKIDEKISSYILKPGEILMVMVGGTLGKTTIVTPNLPPALLNQNLWRLRSYGEHLDNAFEYLLIKVLNHNIQGQTQSTHGHYAMSDYEKKMILLPPLAEQRRIVARVNELMALCDKLDLRIINTENVCQQLCAAVVSVT
jgi:type I restriction enzyme S subunit